MTTPRICVILFVTSKNRHDKKGVVIAILQNENDFGNTLNEEIFELPFVMGGGGSGLYYLVNDVSEDLEHFVQTGKPPEKDRGTCKEYHVFPREYGYGHNFTFDALGMLYNFWTEYESTARGFSPASYMDEPAIRKLANWFAHIHMRDAKGNNNHGSGIPPIHSFCSMPRNFALSR